MARKTPTPPGPPSEESRADLLEQFTSAGEPLTAAQAIKVMQPTLKIKEAQATPILDEFVAAGRLHRYPPKTAKGKPRFWDRDVASISKNAAVEAMREAERPLTAKEVISRMEISFKIAEKELAPILDGLVSNGVWHAIPATTAKGKPRYWNQDVIAYGRLAIRDFLLSKGAQSEASLKKAAKGLSPEQFRTSLHQAEAAQEVWKHPPVGKSKAFLWGARPPVPDVYLKDLGKQLAGVVKKLTEAGVSMEDLRRSLVQMAENAGIPFRGATSGVAGSPPAGGVPTFDLIAQMKRIEPGALRGALVTARDLRKATNLGKAEFDRAALELSRQGRLSLHRHDYASSLSPEEREELVSDGNGTYFVGMAIRQNTQ